MTHAALAPLARLASPRVILLIKSGVGSGPKIANQPGYYLLNGHWHKAHHDKPAPKGVPQSAHPQAAHGDHVKPHIMSTEQAAQLKLPTENVNAPTYNKQLEKLIDYASQGDATAILGMPIGVNTYGKKLAAVANWLLGQMGETQHVVAHGQAAGAHAAVQQEPKFKLSPEQEAVMIATKVAHQLFSPEQSEAFAKLDTEAKHALIKKVADAQAQKEADAAAQAAVSAPTPLSSLAQAVSKVNQIPWHTQYLPDTNTNAPSHNKKVAAIMAAAIAGDVAALQAMKFGSNTYGKKQEKLAQVAIAALGGQPAQPTPIANNIGDAKPVEINTSPPADGIVEMDGFKFKKGEVTGAWNFQHGETLAWHPVENVHTLGKLAKLTGESPAATPAPQILPIEKLKEAIDALAAAGDVASLKAVYEANTKAGNEELAHHAKKALYRLDKTALEPNQPKSVTAPKAIFHNTTDGHNKSWAVHVAPNSAGGFDMVTEYGKIGGTQQKTVKTFPNNGAAHEAANQLKSEKQSKGYTHHTTDYSHKADVGPDAGPKDGDTKQGADGQLVFKDGHWHKVDAPPADPVHAISIPDFEKIDTGVWGKRYKTVAEALKAAVMAGGAEGLKGLVVNHATGAFTIKAGGFVLRSISPGGIGAQGARREAMHKFLTELKAAAGKPKKTSKSKAAAAPPAATVPIADEYPPMDAWVQTGPQGGTNPGGRYKDPTGQEWYCKFPADEDMAKSEVLAAKLYAVAGLAGQDAQLITKSGKVGIASKWTEVSKASSPAALAKAPGAQEGFAVDAWLANWDVVGMGFDNLQVGKDGKAFRVDAGGSLEYRAQGAKKPFGPSVTEIDTMRDAAQNAQSGSVFGKMTKADLTASVRKVAEISDAQIRATVAEFGPGDLEKKKLLAEILIARKLDLIARYPKASKQTAKKALDPAALPVNPAIVPKPHDFENWNGPGKGLSSKDYVNKANSAAEYQMFSLAQAGNLTALKNLEFPEVDKETGQPTGKMLRLNQHPSKNVAQYHADLMQILDEVANPPEALKVFRETDVGTVHAIDAAFPPKAFGTTVTKVASNEKMGFWVVLGAIKGTSKFTPKATSHYSSMAIAKAKEKFKSASALAKHFMTSVQSSGSYNDLFRNGKSEDSSGNKLTDVAKAALQHATEMPEGTTIYRWLKIPPGMMDHINAAKEGTVFQATGPMCTSYDATATKNFGSHRMVIRYAKGAKAVESFGSGGYGGEKEVTTLPNQRFVILSKKMVPDIEHGNHSGQRLELEVLMLPPDLGIQK